MRQVNAVNGSQMVVKLRGGLLPLKAGAQGDEAKLSSLLYTITTDFSTIKKGTLLRELNQ